MAYRKARAEVGSWFVYGKDPETGAPVRWLLRAVPERVLSELRRKHFGKKQERADDPECLRDFAVEAAVYATLDCEGYAPEVDEGAAAYGKFLGEEVTSGQTVVLDGRIGKSQQFRERIMRDALELNLDLPYWVVGRSETLKSAGRKDEADLGKTSAQS